MKPRIVIQFAVTAKEKRAIQRAARASKMTLSQWLRFESDKAVELYRLKRLGRTVARNLREARHAAP